MSKTTSELAEADEFAAELDGVGEVDLDIHPDDLQEIRRTARAQLVYRFHTLKEAILISRALGDSERERQQHAEAVKVLQVLRDLDARSKDSASE